MYCRRWRRPFRCISFALGSLKLHSHSLQWKRMTFPSSLRTCKRRRRVSGHPRPFLEAAGPTYLLHVVVADGLDVALQRGQSRAAQRVRHVRFDVLKPRQRRRSLGRIQLDLRPGVLHLHCGLEFIPTCRRQRICFTLISHPPPPPSTLAGSPTKLILGAPTFFPTAALPTAEGLLAKGFLTPPTAALTMLTGLR